MIDFEVQRGIGSDDDYEKYYFKSPAKTLLKQNTSENI